MEQFHQQLLDPSSYPEETHAVSFKETHISRIYLTDTHAYKLKKPLDLGFLDFSSLAKRHHYCREEVRLNRRYTSGIYLGVVALRCDNGKVFFGSGDGQVIDYAVQMRRLPEERMLNRLIERQAKELPGAMPQLGMALLALFEQSAVCRHEALRNVDVVRENCVENFRQTRTAIGLALTEEAHTLGRSATEGDLAELAELMLAREAGGFVREGHGDLHTANICLTEPICIYDCIEFNRRFRVADLAADLAFLIMDLEFLGRRDLAEILCTHYQAHSADPDFMRLLPFYKRYRAWVRGKVDAILAADPETSRTTRQKAAQLARRYFNLALGYQLGPTLLLTAGLMGVGKTTLARALAGATGASHLRSDVLRKQLAGIPTEQPSRDAYATGLYSREMTARTYTELFNATADLLARGCSVIVDASFAADHERRRFMELADRLARPAWLLHIECPEETTLARLDRRSGDASDGRRELFARQKAGFSEITSTRRVVTVDTSLPVDYNVQSILCRVLAYRERSS
jgi:aminoglycoside phosphotransferase family enzyme/predicted kinase